MLEHVEQYRWKTSARLDGALTPVLVYMTYTSRDGYAVTWTSYNHPSSITSFGESVTFAYKQDHTRWSAVYNGSSGMETTYFIGDLLEKVISAGSVSYRHYIYAGPTKIAIYTPTSSAPQVYYVREDHLGSVSGILNSDGTSYVKESFTAFGARRSSCTWSGPPTAGNLQAIDAVTRHGFTWQTALGAMGLNDMNGRIEDAVTGRFLSPDPFVQDPGFTQNFNRYSYVNNNPLTLVDPSGFDSLGCQNGGVGCTPSPGVTVYGCDHQCQADILIGYQSMLAAAQAWQAYQQAVAQQQRQAANQPGPGMASAAGAGQSSQQTQPSSPVKADMFSSIADVSEIVAAVVDNEAVERANNVVQKVDIAHDFIKVTSDDPDERVDGAIGLTEHAIGVAVPGTAVPIAAVNLFVEFAGRGLASLENLWAETFTNDLISNTPNRQSQ